MQETQPERRIVNEEGRATYKKFQESIEIGSCVAKDLRQALSSGAVTQEQFAKLSILLAEKLEKMVNVDYLTQILNRTSLKPNLDKLTKELNNPSIEKRKAPIKAIEVIFGDIKKFKILNDTYLHSTGDQALKKLAIRLEDSVKRGDMAFRVGGDEFVLLLPVTDDNPMLLESIFERIKNNVNNNLSVTVDGKDILFEISMGYQIINKGSIITAEKILDMADKKMYEAKGGSREIAA